METKAFGLAYGLLYLILSVIVFDHTSHAWAASAAANSSVQNAATIRSAEEIQAPLLKALHSSASPDGAVFAAGAISKSLPNVATPFVGEHVTSFIDKASNYDGHIYRIRLSDPDSGTHSIDVSAISLKSGKIYYSEIDSFQLSGKQTTLLRIITDPKIQPSELTIIEGTPPTTTEAPTAVEAKQ